MRKFLTFLTLTLICVTLALLMLAASGCDGCLGDASVACINVSIHLTETSAANEFHIQLTEIAR